MLSDVKKAELPYQLTEKDLLANTDTSARASAYFSAFIPDTLKAKLFNSSSKIKYSPIAKIEVPDQETYYILKAVSGKNKAALLMTFTPDNQFAAVLPFLIPDTDPTTSQVSSIDNKYNISINISRKQGILTVGEGKDVFAYDRNAKQFSWVMTDLLDENTDIINPIDTFKREHKWSGDYVKDKKNIISVRDGRNENFLTVFIHTEKNDGACQGELRGDFLLISSNTAVYRQGGDPCVLMLTFSASSVSIKEEQGCGNRRGVDCPFEGKFPKKKISKTKETSKKVKRG